MQRGDRQDEKQTLDCLSIIELAGFNPKTIGSIVQEVLFDVEVRAKFIQGANIGGFVADYIPGTNYIITFGDRSRQCQMDFLTQDTNIPGSMGKMAEVGK